MLAFLDDFLGGGSGGSKLSPKMTIDLLQTRLGQEISARQTAERKRHEAEISLANAKADAAQAERDIETERRRSRSEFSNFEKRNEEQLKRHHKDLAERDRKIDLQDLEISAVRETLFKTTKDRDELQLREESRRKTWKKVKLGGVVALATTLVIVLFLDGFFERLIMASKVLLAL